MRFRDYEKQELRAVQNRNERRGDVNLDSSDVHDDDEASTAIAAKVVPLRVRLLENFATDAFDRENIAGLRELSVENLDAMFDRIDMRKNAKNLILNSDKVDDVWTQAPKAIKRIPRFGGALSQIVKLLPNPGKQVELLLVEQFVMMTSASYGFDPASSDETTIRRAITGRDSSLSPRFHKALRTRIAALNPLAHDTNARTIDAVLESIDDLYRERLLLHHKD
jgi:hypothetical protein